MGCDGSHGGTAAWTEYPRVPIPGSVLRDFEVVDALYTRIWEAPKGTRFVTMRCECGTSILVESPDHGWIVSMGIRGPDTPIPKARWQGGRLCVEGAPPADDYSWRRPKERKPPPKGTFAQLYDPDISADFWDDLEDRPGVKETGWARDRWRRRGTLPILTLDGVISRDPPVEGRRDAF